MGDGSGDLIAFYGKIIAFMELDANVQVPFLALIQWAENLRRWPQDQI